MSRAPASLGKTKRRQAAALHTGRYVGALRDSGQVKGPTFKGFNSVEG